MTNPTTRGALTIEQILDAAEDVLLAHGTAGLTLNAVAEQAGITKGGLLYHFGTKNDLERSLEGRFVARIEQRLSKLQPGTSCFSSAMLAEIWEDWNKGKKRFAPLVLGAASGRASKELQVFGASLLERFDAQSPRIPREDVAFFAIIGLLLADLLKLIELPNDRAAGIHLAVQMLVNNG